MADKSKRKRCFVAAECCSTSCPNVQCEEFESYWNVPASDAGLERINCRDCYYNTGMCEDCLFYNEPKYCAGVRL